MLAHAARWFWAKNPQPMTPTRSDEFVIDCRPSVNFARSLQRVPHFGAGEAFGSGHVQDRLLAARDQVDRIGQLAHRIGGNDDGAVIVGMDDVVVLTSMPNTFTSQRI